MDNDIEIWKDILKYEGLYKISNKGNIYSIRKGKQLTLKNHNNGYKVIALCKDGHTKKFYIHRLVAFAFIPNNNPLNTIINHKNEIKDDNRVENLEWCTHKYNSTYGTNRMRLSEKTKKYYHSLPDNIKKEKIKKLRIEFAQYLKKLTPEERKNKFGHNMSDEHKKIASNTIKEYNNMKYILSYILSKKDYNNFITPYNIKNYNIETIYDNELNIEFLLNKNLFMRPDTNIHNQKCIRFINTTGVENEITRLRI